MIQPVLQTERLSLRPFVLSDSAQVQRLAGDWRVADVTAHIPHPYPDGEAERWISTHQPNWAAAKGVSYAICSAADGQLMGAISLQSRNSERSELGYWLGVDYWGHGYVTEACIELIRFARMQLAVNKIYACHLVRNPASGRVLIKAGLKHIGSNQRSCGYRQEMEPLEEYELLLT